jgi:predicted aldo/keto reductase-like oxidoreductase
MRFPVRDGVIDAERATKLIDRAYTGGVNYFDTAYFYHEGQSEPFLGEALSAYPRGSFFLATKMPYWDVKKPGDVETIFYHQLERLKTDYIDFYLMHAMNGTNYDRMIRFKGYEFFERMKAEGRIKHLGFSFHGTLTDLRRMIRNHAWDFAQIQFNYLDYEEQRADLQYQLLTDAGIRVIVMEPVRGGALAVLCPEAVEILRKAAPDKSVASWAIRYAASPENVLCVLSGMSNEEQLADNLGTLSDFRPLSERENAVLQDALYAYRKSKTVRCTACRYCKDCPQAIDIPEIFRLYNDFVLTGDRKALRNAYRPIPPRQNAAACLACGKCSGVCPQSLDIPAQLKQIASVIGFIRPAPSK